MIRYVACLAMALLAGIPLRAGELDKEFGGQTPPVPAVTPVTSRTATSESVSLLAATRDVKPGGLKASELDEEMPSQAWHRGFGRGFGYGGFGRGFGLSFGSGYGYGGLGYGGLGYGGYGGYGYGGYGYGGLGYGGYGYGGLGYGGGYGLASSYLGYGYGGFPGGCYW